MPKLFWSGKLTLPMKILINTNNLLSLFTGSLKDNKGMKDRVKRGYEGEYSDHVFKYDELGYQFQEKSANFQLDGIQFNGMSVLDVGCGTGALAHAAFSRGSTNVVCGDISAYMLNEAKRKKVSNNVKYTFCALDAEGLPFRNNSFDAVISGMTFGTLPNQHQAFAEMVRVAKPGGFVCIGAHGPEHYWEAIDATLRCINKRYVLGYRFEWWPRDEEYIRQLLVDADLDNIQSKRVIWRNEFDTGAAAYDFFAAISSSWWYAKFPQDERIKDSQKTRGYFNRNKINIVTDDIVIGSGYKHEFSG